MTTLNMAETLGTLIDNSQETDCTYDPDEDEIDLSLLRLNSFGNSSDRRRANSSPPQFQSYGSFGSSSATAITSPVKRPSPESKEADEPRRKKLFIPRPEEEEEDANMMGYSKIPLPVVELNPNRIRSPLYKRSLSDTFASPVGSILGSGNTRNGVAQETSPSSGNVPSLPPRPPMFRRSVSDVSPAPSSKALLRSSRFNPIPDGDFVNPESSEANKMLYVIKDGVRELDQWCNKLLKYGEAVSSVKQDDSPKAQDEVVQEDQQRDCKEGVKVDRVGEAFVVEINCPCGRNYRTLFSGRDCYYKLL
ncbi:hypothetical protein CARUB_v10023708mg [Capsella rubella]|uniref:Uncharacterized protein n=1 Tax=Capsella rubella TaxID=81985 RepID=R0FXW9_9BRAS|nr:uncharacterized protein LOC17888048 [Capsella rubella]EOA27571.1 hypothetical protein CARUB_v10023708mg [Capsella rubella]